MLNLYIYKQEIEREFSAGPVAFYDEGDSLWVGYVLNDAIIDDGMIFVIKARLLEMMLSFTDVLMFAIPSKFWSGRASRDIIIFEIRLNLWSEGFLSLGMIWAKFLKNEI